jgi:predicted metal-dependent hydrolase
MTKIDQIIRTKRKSIALIVQRDGRLVVRAPIDATDEQILTVVQKKNGWIHSKQEAVLSTYPQVVEKEFVNGEGFWYLGTSYRLRIVDDANHPLELDTYFLLDRYVLPHARDVFTAWYKGRALLVISERVAWYAAKNGINYKQVKITSAQTRWGSCSAKGTLSFSWRLVMAPVPVIDYVVVHELVHLLEKNHGRAFWAKVKAIMPDYKQKIEWLDINGHLLRI